MSAGESLMPSAQTDDAKTELGIDAQFTREGDQIAVTTAPVIVGLTKEELEHYRNDPKFRALRWILFVAFWLIWLGLFVGAIALIVFSPRQDVNPDVKWYKVANTYEIFVPAFFNSDADTDKVNHGDLNGVYQKLDYLRELKIDSIILSGIFEMDAAWDRINNYKITGRQGSEDDFKKLVKAAFDDYEIRTIVDLTTPKGDVFGFNKAAVVKYLKDFNAHGVYIHSDDAANIEKLYEVINNSSTGKDDDFALFVGCANTLDKCTTIKADVVFIDSTDNVNPNNAAAEIDAHLGNYSKTTVKNETTFAVLGNSGHHKRISVSASNSHKFYKLLNALRLFVYPAAHSLYGDEYGCQNSKDKVQYGTLPGWDLIKGDTPFFKQLEECDTKANDVKAYFTGLGTLRHKLKYGNTTFVSSDVIIRLSHDKIHYALFYNRGEAPKEIEYNKIVPAHLADHLTHAQVVYQDGTDSATVTDISKESIKLPGYDYIIYKLAA